MRTPRLCNLVSFPFNVEPSLAYCRCRETMKAPITSVLTDSLQQALKTEGD